MTIQKDLPKKKGESGFSLVELIVVIAIAGIMLAAATPTFSSWLEKNRLNGVARKIANDLHFCRQQAISENQYYVVDFNSTAPIAYTIKYGQTLGTYTDLRTENLTDSNGFTSFVASGDPVFDDRGRSNSQVTLTITNANNDVKTIVVSIGGKISIS